MCASMYRASRPPMLWAMMLTASGAGAHSASAACKAAARSAMELEGGTVGVMTIAPCAVRASLIPCQYWTEGRYELS